MAEGRYILGSGLKFDINIEAEGFDIETDNFNIDVYCGDKKLSYTQDNIYMDDQHHHYLYVDTSSLVAGNMKMVVTAFVPDESVPTTEIRKEIAVVNIGVLESITKYGVPSCNC